MDRLRVLVAAAGRGTRAGLPYPKTLYPVQGKPILIRIAELISPYDMTPTVVVSPAGRRLVSDCLAAHHRAAHLVEQPDPRGMGDAVLRFMDSPAADEAEHLLLIWGDIPLIQPQTVAAVVDAHFTSDNDFTFATRLVESAYTVVERNADGDVMGVLETRESGIQAPRPGEREIGLFVFRTAPVFAALRQDVPERYGHTTGEHGFLYLVRLLVRNGFKVEALPCATELDLVSLNSISDLKGYA